MAIYDDFIMAVNNNEPLLWSEKNVCGDTVSNLCDSPKIPLPAGGPLLLCFYAEFAVVSGFSNEVELVIAYKGINPICYTFA